MSRSKRQGHPRCPEGRQCDWCGPKVAAEHRDERRAPLVDPEDTVPPEYWPDVNEDGCG